MLFGNPIISRLDLIVMLSNIYKLPNNFVSHDENEYALIRFFETKEFERFNFSALAHCKGFLTPTYRVLFSDGGVYVTKILDDKENKDLLLTVFWKIGENILCKLRL
jgi:hypothetical protein